jgi:hypothetical protein
MNKTKTITGGNEDDDNVDIGCPYVHAVQDYQDFTVKSTPASKRQELNIGNIWSNKIQCKLCGWYIRSKNKNHFVRCNCGACFVDGGSWYNRVGGNPEDINYFVEYYDDVNNELNDE